MGLFVDCLSENLASYDTLEARKSDACMLVFEFLPSLNIKQLGPAKSKNKELLIFHQGNYLVDI